MFSDVSRNKGFELMIPKPKEEKENLFNHQIKFTLFNKEFEFSFNVTKKE